MEQKVFQKFFEETEITSTGETMVTNSEVKRIIGKIIKIAEHAGWGFITSKELKFTRIFFHWTSLKQETLNFTELKVGMKVEFTPIEFEDKGWRAIRIMVVE